MVTTVADLGYGPRITPSRPPDGCQPEPWKIKRSPGARRREPPTMSLSGAGTRGSSAFVLQAGLSPTE